MSVLVGLTILAHMLNMSQYNKLSGFQYARFQTMYLHLDCFWQDGIPTMHINTYFRTINYRGKLELFYDIFIISHMLIC